VLTTLKDVLADARKNGYAVPAFDCVEDVMVRAILETCEELRSPVVLMCLVGADLEGNGWAYVPGLVKAVADFHDIPVVLHLDHAESIKKAVDAGFTSVMIDGSMHPFEKNVEITKATAQIAHPKSISVEGELGWVGGFDLQARSTGRPVLTEPKEVEKFVSMTGLDALASRRLRHAERPDSRGRQERYLQDEHLRRQQNCDGEGPEDISRVSYKARPAGTRAFRAAQGRSGQGGQRENRVAAFGGQGMKLKRAKTR